MMMMMIMICDVCEPNMGFNQCFYTKCGVCCIPVACKYSRDNLSCVCQQSDVTSFDAPPPVSWFLRFSLNVWREEGETPPASVSDQLHNCVCVCVGGAGYITQTHRGGGGVDWSKLMAALNKTKVLRPVQRPREAVMNITVLQPDAHFNVNKFKTYEIGSLKCWQRCGIFDGFSTDLNPGLCADD